jgi:hypothetical protein
MTERRTEIMSKFCSACKQWKTLDLFGRNCGNKDGLTGQCKECLNRKRRESYANTVSTESGKAKLRERDRRWYEEMKGDPERRAKYKDRMHKSALKRMYGVEKDEYENMLKEQNEQCLICNIKACETTLKKLAVDHCHKTSRVRGLLCSRCNLLLGQARDDTNLLSQSIAYLNEKGID